MIQRITTRNARCLPAPFIPPVALCTEATSLIGTGTLHHLRPLQPLVSKRLAPERVDIRPSAYPHGIRIRRLQQSLSAPVQQLSGFRFSHDNSQDAGHFCPRLHDVCALLGAGDIIFPPSVGLAAGEFQWSAALGFLLTGVGLPLLGVVALARVGGGLDTLTSPIGKAAGTLMGLSIYLTIGPFLPHRAPRRCRLKWAWHRLPATRRKRC